MPFAFCDRPTRRDAPHVPDFAIVPALTTQMFRKQTRQISFCFSSARAGLSVRLNTFAWHDSCSRLNRLSKPAEDEVYRRQLPPGIHWPSGVNYVHAVQHAPKLTF